MEKPGKQLFIFPEDSGGGNIQNSQEVLQQKELSPGEKTIKHYFFKHLQELVDEYGELNNQALSAGKYFKDPAKQRDVDWINEFAGRTIVKLSESYPDRMTYVPVGEQKDLGNSSIAA